MAEKFSMNTEVPNAGRVYDYVLGGSHNFEVDRQAAEFMISLLPSTRKWVRMLRMFMHRSINHLAAEGFEQFLDLASGLPTVDHIHQILPDAKVIYTDSDSATVGFAQELIGENDKVRYLQTDIRALESILTSAAVETFFVKGKRVAIGFNAMTCFLTHEEIAQLMKTLYDWAPVGSKLYATFEAKDADAMTPKLAQFVGMFDQMGTPYRFLTLEESQQLISPWQVDGNGFRPLAEWLDLEDQINLEDREGVGLEFYGVYLIKG